MNKRDLVRIIADKTDQTRSSVDKTISAFQNVVTEALFAGDDVRLLGFGTFSKKRTNARKGRNPRTGETMDIPAKNMAKFKSGSDLSKAINS